MNFLAWISSSFHQNDLHLCVKVIMNNIYLSNELKDQTLFEVEMITTPSQG
jgi:hypothetical protein